MPELPPATEVVDALKYAVAPSAVGAGAVFGLCVLSFWLRARRNGSDWRATVAWRSGMALYAGMMLGDLTRKPFPLLLPDSDGKWWQWGWLAFTAILFAETIASSPGVTKRLGHLIRLAGFAVGPCYLIPQAWTPDVLWWLPVILGMWGVLTEAGDRLPGWSLPAAVTVAAGGVAAVSLHQITHGLADVATFVFSALAAIAVLTAATRTGGNSAAAAGAVVLAVVLVLGQSISPKPLPKNLLRLAAFAPLLIGLLLIPVVRRTLSDRAAGFAAVVLVAVPVTAAVVWAMQVAPLGFGGGEDEW